ncbi:MAG: putative DNA-binding domain-containing protein [Pseudomonadota bacterium]|nr:putative DNA-binding domain-containing protein [Pseudomonadota bacterium]
MAALDDPAPPAGLREQQLALTRHLRDPAGVPAPAGMDPRRLSVYRDLLLNNIDGLLAGNFPVLRAVLGLSGWRALVEEFHRDHRCRTPLFPQIGGEFLAFLQARATPAPPFLAELAHYEWAELALQIHQVEPDLPASATLPATERAAQRLLDGAPRLSPLAWPLAYRWPVHRIGPSFIPVEPSAAPTLLLLRRGADGSVRFSELGPMAFRLIQRLDEHPGDSGRTHLLELSRESGALETPGGAEQCLQQGEALLLQLLHSGVVTGVAPARSR